MYRPVHKYTAGLKAKLFRGLGDPSRLLIIETLRQGPGTVTEIVAATCLSQPNVSNHLGCLRECGLVTAEQKGRFVYYCLNGEMVNQILALADQLLEKDRGIQDCDRYSLAEVMDDNHAAN